MLGIPSFDQDADAFEKLVEDVLGEDPELRRFSARGKDGAIDLSSTQDGVRHVYECKQISEDGLDAALRRWSEVAGRLERHLRDPGGPTPGQAQYGPWYRTSPAIRAYTFCISSRLANQEQHDKLREEIQGFFERLAESAHLGHLAGLTVDVLDWDRIWQRLEKHPHLTFRWFPERFPRGFSALDRATRLDTFRAYLTNEKLPFYSRAQHLVHHPGPADGEDVLLDRLLDDDTATGLVVTGSGGVGKSRLAVELGRRAARRGWFAARGSRLQVDALETFARALVPELKTVIVVDYVETEEGFDDIVARLADINHDAHLRLRLVATCRTSYYPKVADLEDLGVRRLDLSPTDATARAWLEGYRQETIRHILRGAGLTASRELIDLCSDTPALAVFVAYLKERGSVDLDLHELIAERDFGSWFRRQVKKSFPDREIDEGLALWMGLMPLPDPLPDGLRRELGSGVFDRLVTDSWIERIDDTGPRWTTAHDVLADQTVLSFLDEKKRGQEQGFVERWLETGRRWASSTRLSWPFSVWPTLRQSAKSTSLPSSGVSSRSIREIGGPGAVKCCGRRC